MRAPGPCRPTKLRFDVEATRAPGAAMSPLVPTHMEQPGWRHSKPAPRNTSCSPSASAWRFTGSEPGTTQARTPSATLRPRATAAALRRSSMRLFVQLPMKTRSIGTWSSGVPGARPM